ncbi:hypothetical protein P261_01421 [Lachnospiraceae bacterium TWA4]|nr:hypothetical protein P261_01421 [Lachnospiraceae bacterium TWA4]
MKVFNTAVLCNPNKHYMVDISDKIEEIIEDYITPGKYFTINRARQYGKTTVMDLLAKTLKDTYYVIQLSFEWADSFFESQEKFVQGFIQMVEREMKFLKMPAELLDKWSRKVDNMNPFIDLDERITNLCEMSDREIVLMIDEVDKASNNKLMMLF